MMSISSIQRQLQSRSYWLLDGAIGTELEARGYRTSLPFWTAFAAWDCPDLLTKIYLEYLESGSNLLTANTFRISYYLFEKHHRLAEYQPLLSDTCQLTRDLMSGNQKVLLTASLTTLEDCYRPDLVPPIAVLEHYHERQLMSLSECPVDLILAETINSVTEATVIMKLANQMGLPLIMSVVTNGKGALLSGESLHDLVAITQTYQPVALSLNCRSTEELRGDARILSVAFGGIKGVYSNAPGNPHSTKGWEAAPDSLEVLTKFISDMQSMDFRIFGGCCGTTPPMINAMHQRLAGLKG
jgi:S-methylmethionine-dependent homocysteine/selenocysteine methylase